MKKIVLVCGVIAGLISISWGILSVNFITGLSMNTCLFLGYATMILAFSLIYVGVKKYRDEHNGGLISFGKAMKISLLITLVASTVYVIIWLVDYYVFVPDFGKHYLDMIRADMVAKGASAAEIQKSLTEVSKEMEIYKNPVFNVLITYSEIVPVGIVISLISALILKNNKPATTNA